MAQEKEYSDIVQEQVEKLQEALKKKKKNAVDDDDDPIRKFLTIVIGGPMFVLMVMFVSLIVCETVAVAFVP